jgi:hypothetical protein
MRIAALNETRNIIRGRVEPTEAAVISSALKTRSIEIGSSDPQSNLSAMCLPTPISYLMGGQDGRLKRKSRAALPLSAQTAPTGRTTAQLGIGSLKQPCDRELVH